MTYTVKYRCPGQWRRRTVKRVAGDAIENGVRVLILEDNRQIHIPLDAEVWFDKSRHELIRRRMEREAGQPIIAEAH